MSILKVFAWEITAGRENWCSGFCFVFVNGTALGKVSPLEMKADVQSTIMLL